MISFPRILTRVALGSWMICALLPLDPIAAALAGSGSTKSPSFVATEEQRAAVQRLLERDDLTTIEGQAVDAAALRRLTKRPALDSHWAAGVVRAPGPPPASAAAAAMGSDRSSPL